MSEPLDPPIPCPFNGCGWPMACLRLELTAGCTTLEMAAFTLASLSRQQRMGVVARFNGADITAFPHQTAAEIARTHLVQVLMASGRDVAARAVAKAGAPLAAWGGA